MVQKCVFHSTNNNFVARKYVFHSKKYIFVVQSIHNQFEAVYRFSANAFLLLDELNWFIYEIVQLMNRARGEIRFVQLIN